MGSSDSSSLPSLLQLMKSNYKLWIQMRKDAKVIFISKYSQLNITVASRSLVPFVKLFKGSNKLSMNFIHLPKATK